MSVPPTPSAPDAPGPAPFPPQPEVIYLRPCSDQQCRRGHTWPIAVTIAMCPGCQQPILAVRMENCPKCNEPSERLRLRTDHLATGMGIMPLCRPGAKSLAEVNEIILDRRHAEEVESGDFAAAQSRTIPTVQNVAGPTELVEQTSS
jgi:hypothetical protein